MARVKVKIYQYPKCSTCRKALRWLDEHEVSYEAIDIVQSPPSQSELKSVLEASGLPLKGLFNTSGQSYREGNWPARLPQTSEREALAALAKDGKLIKRPLVIGKGWALVGFREPEYQARFGREA